MSFNLAVILSESAQSAPDRPVALFSEGRLTYRELDVASDWVAASLAATGVKPGDPVALQLPNIPQFLVSYFGILKAGAVVVPLNVMLRAPEVAFHLGDSGARVLITWEGILAEAAKGAEAAGLEQIYAVGHPAGAGVAHPFERLLDVTVPFEMITRQPTDTAVIVYTSGTTGRPKGAELTHIQLYMNADIPGRLFDVQPDDIVITVLPLFHVFGLSSILNCCVRFGCTMSLIPRFTPGAVLAAIQRDGATIFEGVPTMYAAMLHLPDADPAKTATLRVCVSGGAALPVEILRGFEEKFGCMILEGYGLSETSPVASFNHPDRVRKPGSIGTPVEGVEMRLVDDEGRTVPDGEIGEIVIRGHNVMKGYWNKPEATAEAMTGEGEAGGGWFRTGDMARADSDGYYYIVDRKKDLIIRGGYNVYPREIEEVLHEHPAVAEVAVIGIPHPSLGEEVGAAVALKPGATATPEELRAFARDRVAAYKYPRHVWLVDTLPKGPTGKILRREVRPAEDAR